MTKLKQRRRAHSVNRCASGLRRAAAPQRDLGAAFNEWSAAKRFRVSEQPAAGR